MGFKLKPNEYPNKSKADFIIAYKPKGDFVPITVGTAFWNDFGQIDLNWNEGWEPKPPESRIRKVIRKIA